MEHNERLTLAFLYHFAQLMVIADEALDKAEVRALEGLNRDLVRANLMNSDGTLREAYDGTRDQAMHHLHRLLPESDRRDLLERLRFFAECDGHVDPRELQTLQSAATALGLTVD